VATTLIGHFVAAISGSAIARQTSFLLDALETQVFATGFRSMTTLPQRGLRSRAFDGEGLPVKPMELVADGVLTTWLADSAAARQLGIQRPVMRCAASPARRRGAQPIFISRRVPAAARR
jgi:PmbA protein